MATSTSFQENGQALGMPAPVIPTSAHAGIQQMMAAAMAGRNGPAGLDSSSLMMQYYQTMAEKCWGLNSPPGCLNSPPGSDSSSSAGSTSVQQSNNTIKNSPATSQHQGKRRHKSHIPIYYYLKNIGYRLLFLRSFAQFFTQICMNCFGSS